MISIGSRVRWTVDVDKVYSASTKLRVGTVGVVVEPENRAYPPSKYSGNFPGCFDVDFGNYIVWDIPYYHLEEVIE